MPDNEHIITFHSLQRGRWLNVIAEAKYAGIAPSHKVVLDITCIKSTDELQAVHLVTLACLIEDLTTRYPV